MDPRLYSIGDEEDSETEMELSSRERQVDPDWAGPVQDLVDRLEAVEYDSDEEGDDADDAGYVYLMLSSGLLIFSLRFEPYGGVS